MLNHWLIEKKNAIARKKELWRNNLETYLEQAIKFKQEMKMNLIHKYYINNENFYNLNPLQSAVKFGIIFSQSEKVIASRGKLNYLQLANESTPLDRAFFVRNIRTPKEYADFVFNLNPIILSMVERNEPSMTGCLPIVAVFHLVTFYRPTVESLAVDSENLQLESTQMYQFIFALICAPQIKIRLLADNEQQARSRFTDGDTLLFVGKINQNPFKNNRALAALPTLSVSATQGGANV